MLAGLKSCLNRGGRFGAVLLVVLAGGCSMLFDAPSQEGVSSIIPDRVLGDLASMAASAGPEMELKPTEMATSLATSEARRIVQKQAEQYLAVGDVPVPSQSPEDWREVQRTLPARVQPVAASNGPVPPSLRVERIGADSAQLVVEGLSDGVVKLDGEPIGLVQTQAVRVIALAPGDHAIRVEYVGRPPFSADFYIEKGERITLSDSQ